MSANVTISVTESLIFKALGDFLQGLFVDVEIERGQQNDTPAPIGDFITMTTILNEGLSTTTTTYTATPSAGTGWQHMLRTTKWGCQIDFYGSRAQQHALIFSTVVRTPFATESFTHSGRYLMPLYCSEPRNTTMINGENRYEPRFTVDFYAQINPVVTAPQEFFDSLNIQTNITESI